MLQVEGLTLYDRNHCILLSNACFRLPNYGFVSIYGDHEELHHLLAQSLAGVYSPNASRFIYNDQEMTLFDEKERSIYRSCFASFLFHDFQIIPDQTVYDNITMFENFPRYVIQKELAFFQMEDKVTTLAEDLTPFEQWKMVLVRCMLRCPMMLVVDSESTPLAKEELMQLYSLLDMLKSRVLVVVIGDKQSIAYANRIIEIADGYILSDTHTNSHSFPQVNQIQQPYTLKQAQIEAFDEKLYHFIHWKLRLATVFLMLSFIALSVGLFSLNLDVTDIQMRLMENKQSSILAVEKLANLNGEYVDNYYDYLNENDVVALQKALGKKLILGYYPTDLKAARYLVYGSSQLYVTDILDEYTMIEADSAQELGFAKMYGSYPQAYDEIALPSTSAYRILKEVLNEPFYNTQEQCERMLGMKVLWFGQPLTITAIFPAYEADNANMELQMHSYGSSLNQAKLMSGSFFVKRGFAKKQEVLTMPAYQKTGKRLIYGDRIVAEFEGLRQGKAGMRYFDGEYHYTSNELEEDEILIDYDAALSMGFRASYLSCVKDQAIDVDQAIRLFEEFAESWVGKEITLQTYRVPLAPQATQTMNRVVRIKGIMLPRSFSYEDYERYYKKEGIGAIYASKEMLAAGITQNHYIKVAFFQSHEKKELKHALDYLNSHEGYDAFLTNDRILKFFVVDLHEVAIFLLILGGLAFLAFLYLYIFLLKSASSYIHKDCTIHYLLGETKSALRSLVIKYFQMVLWIRSLFSWLCAALTLMLFVFTIYFALYASITIMWSLTIPCILLFVGMLLVRIVMHIVFQRTTVLDEMLIDEERL